MSGIAQVSNNRQSSIVSEYVLVSDEKLKEISDNYSWISEPIARASDYVRGMPFFDYVDSMKFPVDFRDSAVQLWYHSATFPKVMGLMLGLTPLSENHMMSFYSEHAQSEATHHQMLMDWMLMHELLGSESEIASVIPTIETNSCVNLAYQMALEQSRDKWLVAVNCGIERCSNQFFKAVAPKMHSMGAGHNYFDLHVEADEHHSIMGLSYIRKDLDHQQQVILVRKALEGISLWAAMIHSWIGVAALPTFELDGSLSRRLIFDCRP